MWLVRIEQRRAAIHQAMQKGNSLMRDQPRKKRKHRVRRILLTLLVVLVLAAVGYNTYSQMKAEYTVTYDGYTATTGSISNSLSFSGSLQALVIANVPGIRSPGRSRYSCFPSAFSGIRMSYCPSAETGIVVSGVGPIIRP